MFALPNFNLVFDWWDLSHIPAIDPPDVSGIPGQLYLHSKADLDAVPLKSTTVTPALYIRIPTTSLGLGGPLVGSFFSTTEPTLVQQYWWVVQWWEWTHMGFPNAYLSFLVQQCDSFGTVPDPNR